MKSVQWFYSKHEQIPKDADQEGLKVLAKAVLSIFPWGSPQWAAPYDVRIMERKPGNWSNQKWETSGPALS